MRRLLGATLPTRVKGHDTVARGEMLQLLLLQLNADGTFLYGTGRSVGGGANWSIDTGREPNDVSKGN